MIPLKLYLTNFLSYRATAELDFSEIHLACISGLNGAGKSTVLDGMTWALFGKCRSKSDDDVVHRLAAAAGGMAEVRFEFGLEGNVYRIIRQKRPGRASILEFQLATGDDKWKTLTEAKSRDTQATIEKVLRMNYDTFTNASFFLQGKADEFTTNTPGRRKEILAELLGVTIWESYKEAISERRKQEEVQLVVFDSSLAEIDKELAEEPQRQQALHQAQADLERATVLRKAKEQVRDQIRQTQESIGRQKEQVQFLNNSRQRALTALSQLEQQQRQQQQQRANHQALFAQRPTIESAYIAWQEAEAHFQSWQTRYEQFNQLQQARQPHQVAVEAARSRLQTRQQQLQKQGQEAQAKSQERQSQSQTLREGQQRLVKLVAQLAQASNEEKAWHEARTELQRLDGEQKLHQRELEQLQSQAKQLEVMRQEQMNQERVAREAEIAFDDLSQQLEEADKARERQLQLQGDVDRLKGEQANLREKMKKLDERISRLQSESGGNCPLCGQVLSDSHRQTVLAELGQEGRQDGGQYRENKAMIEQLTLEVGQLEQKATQSGRIKSQQTAQQARLSKAQARLDEIKRAVTNWETSPAPGRIISLQTILQDDTALKSCQHEVARLATAVKEKATLEKQQQEWQVRVSKAEARIAQIDQDLQLWVESGEPELIIVSRQLAENDLAPEAQVALAALDQQIATVGYDGLKHSSARQQRERLKEAPAKYQQLQQAEAAVGPLDQVLAALGQQISDKKDEIASFTSQRDLVQAEIERLVATAGNLNLITNELTSLREQENEAQRRLGAAQQRLAVLEDLGRQRVTVNQHRVAQALLIQRLKMIEKACGRDGVQTMLIDHALPEIEESANELLDRLTGGDMRVVFDTQKELKSRKETVETLEIRISDPAGERPYENFSGGEQFRVNFAVRLALSRILSKRAGARLQTLVIDEGFGSQDPAGRQRLIEAIHAIQDDFARILVITHIDELRDAFPARIEVEKGPAGSRLSVIHN